jgi:hypothetical protein
MVLFVEQIAYFTFANHQSIQAEQVSWLNPMRLINPSGLCLLAAMLYQNLMNRNPRLIFGFRNHGQIRARGVSH